MRQVITRQPVMMGNTKIGDKEVFVTQTVTEVGLYEIHSIFISIFGPLSEINSNFVKILGPLTIGSKFCICIMYIQAVYSIKFLNAFLNLSYSFVLLLVYRECIYTYE